MLASLTAAAVLFATSSALAQTCSPQLTVGAPYDIKSNIDDTYIWVFNGASHGTPSAVYLVCIPPKSTHIMFSPVSTGTISFRS
ncbi:hypothetical protein GYMLUDRAFT_78366 [Collybiopsis luxurians FD-317 M1]|uniref:Uncharacterized protein n=1 Tax=Collybiopsis luxurians FD-317 M1 TaxID=944289 RepID=A0A0D0B9W2_9AGAR|nr:hypothetical protein GYMLUDRAFT_78366 [Collybiopsis luxurians FD-317 M1]